MEYPLDKFPFTVKLTNSPKHVRLHLLSEFISPWSITPRQDNAKPVPDNDRYSFDCMTKNIGEIGEGFEFIVPTVSQSKARFTVRDQASLSRLIGALSFNVKSGNLNLTSSTFEAELLPLNPAGNTNLETPVVTPAADAMNHNTSPTPHDDQRQKGQDIIVIEDDDDDDGGGNGDDEKDGLLGYLRNQNLMKGNKVHDLAWIFNMSSADKIDMDTTWDVPGMRSRATLSQCVFIYELGCRLREDVDMQGIYNADGVGNGKTFTTLMLLVLRRLASLTRQHITAHPEQHLFEDPAHSAEEGDRCGFTHLIGIQCVCEKNSILQVFLDRLPDSYSLVTGPAAMISVWEDHYIGFIKPAFDGQSFPFRGQPVLHGYLWDDRASLHPLGKSPEAALNIFMVQPQIPQTSKSKPIRVSDAPKADMWTVDQLGEVLADSHPIDFRPHTLFSRKHVMSLIIVGRERLSLYASPNGTSQADIVKLWITVKKPPAKEIKVAKCFLLNPSTIICDEAQEYKSFDNKLAQSLRGYWQRKDRLSQPKPFAMFLSATPAIKTLRDLELASSLINRSPSRHETVKTAPQNADRQSKERHSQEYRGAIDAACKAVDPWMISRAGYSPMLDSGQPISILYPPPETVVKPFDTPRDLQQSLDRTIDKVRLGILATEKAVERTAFENVLQRVAGADLMWKAGSVPGLQACVEADEAFPYRRKSVEADVKLYDRVATRGNSAYLRKLNLLTRNDNMFPEMVNIIRQASQGRVADRPDFDVSSEPLHLVLFTQHACNAAISYVYLKENCGTVADIFCLLSDTPPDQRARKLAEMRLLSQNLRTEQGGKSLVIVTTFSLAGFGLNDFVFCNIMMQLGEPQTQAKLIQATGRIARLGQTKKTFRFYLKREGSESEELLRMRNERRFILLNARVERMRLFHGVTLV